MANTSNPVMNGLQNGQPDLDQDRRRWFNDFEAIKARFEAEKETIRSRFLQQQRDACTDLDEEARHADMPGLPQKAHELMQKYQNELRSHRWAACQHRFDEEEKDRVQREKNALREHHILFPILGPSGHNGLNATYGPAAGPSRRPSTAKTTTTTATTATTATLRGQTPPNGRMALPSEMLARAIASSSLANNVPQPRQPLPQGGTGMPSHTTHPNQHGLSRQANGASGDASSTQMQHQQLLNQSRQPQQPMGQSQRNPHNQHIPHNPNWLHHGQPGSQHGSPHMAPIYQNRPVNGSTVANGPPRVLASQVPLPILGSNHYGHAHMRIKPSARTLTGGDLADSMHGNRVPLPPMHMSAMGNRDDRLQTHNGMNMTQLSTPRADDLARQAMEVHRLPKRQSDASDVSARDADFKRTRLDTPQPIAPRTITFQEVYQDGKAEFKHNIVKYDDVFYILRCDEHGVHFKQNALAAAAKHLHGASHGHQKKEHKLAVETIGFHVVDCTEELAALNNACVRQAFENGYKPLNQLHGPKSGGKRHSISMPAVVDAAVDRVSSVSQSPFQAPVQAAALENVTEQDETEHGHQQDIKQDNKQEDSMPTKDMLNPKAGELYHARWPRSSKVYIVMVLGWTDLRMCGWEAKLSETQLYDKKIRPSCYTYNDDGIAGWASGFGDDEPRVLERDVPVLWFESKGKTRLGWLGVKWLLKPMVLDDPSRPTDPDNPSNQARKTYAEIRGYDSFEAMLAASGTEGAVPTTTKVPSSASASDSDSTPDVDMYDFGDNPPVVDDSDDEDYVERRSRKGRATEDEGGGEDDDETAGADERPVTPQPLRRSTQERRPSSRLGGGGWPSGRMGATAGTRLSAQKDKSTADDEEDVTMKDARQTTPLKERSTGDATPKAAGEVEGLLLNVALGTPEDPVKGGNAKAAGFGAAVRSDSSASESSVFPSGSESEPAERATLSELSRSSPFERCNVQEGPEKADVKTARDGEKYSLTNHAAAMAKLAQSAIKAVSKSPSQDREAAQISPVLQVANLVNNAAAPEKVAEQPSSGASQAKPKDVRRPLPSGPGTRVIVAEPATIPRASMSHDMSTGGIGAQKKVTNRQSSVDLTVQSNQEAETQSARCGSAGSGDSAARRSDPRMSISNAVDDHKNEGIKRTEAGLVERNAAEEGNNGGLSGNNTPSVLVHIGFANDARWRAVRASESPRMPAAMVQSPVIDRSEAASPALSGKKEAETSIDVAEFHEGDRRWAHEGRFLRFVLEDEPSGIARSLEEDGMEVTVDASQVKAAQMTGSEVRLVLKTGGEQRLVFGANALTGSHRGARMQTARFYRWVTGRNTEIEHIG
ncbi:hypothetical protein CTA2_4760 [Colletotrichum tanaceti]|uniref:Uncharacterized protein n=1 Tax=Colletotrichum tanaceti TaxID=1306861 RepID=A0A4U6XS58_9PEZI|nr:hypothetical protein CTA2_4760 [Colletotrichum tanaceti]TKW58720.1 hypothetical protein CTA1_3178 [Colletotrichum tanaceti]